MTVEELNLFLDRTDLTPEQEVLRDSIKVTQAYLQKNVEERNQLTTALREREQLFLRAQGEMSGYLRLVDLLQPKEDLKI